MPSGLVTRGLFCCTALFKTSYLEPGFVQIALGRIDRAVPLGRSETILRGRVETIRSTDGSIVARSRHISRRVTRDRQYAPWPGRVILEVTQPSAGLTLIAMSKRSGRLR